MKSKHTKALTTLKDFPKKDNGTLDIEVGNFNFVEIKQPIKIL